MVFTFLVLSCLFSALNAVNLIKSVVVITANECGYRMYRYNLEVTYDRTHGDHDINDAFRGKIYGSFQFEDIGKRK